MPGTHPPAWEMPLFFFPCIKESGCISKAEQLREGSMDSGLGRSSSSQALATKPGTPPTHHFWTLFPRSASLPSILTPARQTAHASMWMHELEARPWAREPPGPSSPNPPLPWPNTHLPLILSPLVPHLAEIRSRLPQHLRSRTHLNTRLNLLIL